MKRRTALITIAIVVGAIAWAGASGQVADMIGVAWLQRKLLFPRHLVSLKSIREPADERIERSYLESRGEKIESWFLPADGVTRERPGPLAVFAHGNGEVIDQWPALLAPYLRLGVSVLLPEYRGYGRSSGEPSEPAIVEDFQRALERALRDPRVDSARVVYHGRSLGGGVVCALAARRAPQALVLESTFTSVVDVARGMGIPRFLIVDRFESLSCVAKFTGPILVLHGERDTLVPVSHAHRLASSNPRAKLVLYDVGHNDLPPPGSDYWQQIERTLREASIL